VILVVEKSLDCSRNLGENGDEAIDGRVVLNGFSQKLGSAPLVDDVFLDGS